MGWLIGWNPGDQQANGGNMLADGTYVGIVGTLDVVNGRATLRASVWSDWEDGSHGTCPALPMSAAEIAQHTWYPADGLSLD